MMDVSYEWGTSFCYFFLYYYFTINFLLFKYSFLPFPPPQPNPPSLLTSLPFPLPRLHYCSCVLYNCSYKPFTLFPWNSLPSPLWDSLLVTANLFSISVSLVTSCLFVCFVDYVPVKGEIIWYLSFTAWLISLSIISSIHAVGKRLGAPPFSLLHRIPLCKCTIVFWSIHLLLGT